MKRKYANRPDWKRIIRNRYSCMFKERDRFNGYVTLFFIDELTEPAIMGCQGKKFCVADAGYGWLQHFPQGSHYTVTSMFDEKGQIVQHYIDIVHEHGVTEAGIPWFDDLYLDVVHLPTGELEIIDGDDLDEALANKRISPEQHALAWDVANKLKGQIEAGAFPLFDLCMQHYRELMGKL